MSLDGLTETHPHRGSLVEEEVPIVAVVVVAVEDITREGEVGSQSVVEVVVDAAVAAGEVVRAPQSVAGHQRNHN